MRTTAAQARAISRGTKTQLRVPVDARLTARPLRPARRHAGRPFNPTADDILSIDGGHTGDDGWTTTYPVHCKITAVGRCTLGVLTEDEARAEVYETVQEFEIAWVEQHHGAWLDKQIADLIEYGEPEDEAHKTRPLWARSRYADYWASRDVWVLWIEPFDDLPLLLPGLPDEPEAIPVDRIRHHWTERAERRHADALTAVRELDRQLLTREQRITQLHRNAHLRGVDVSREVWLLRRRLPTLSTASLEKHVRGIESRIYPDAA